MNVLMYHDDIKVNQLKRELLKQENSNNYQMYCKKLKILNEEKRQIEKIKLRNSVLENQEKLEIGKKKSYQMMMEQKKLKGKFWEFLNVKDTSIFIKKELF